MTRTNPLQWVMVFINSLTLETWDTFKYTLLSMRFLYLCRKVKKRKIDFFSMFYN